MLPPNQNLTKVRADYEERGPSSLCGVGSADQGNRSASI
jgi:hypothetical protein